MADQTCPGCQTTKYSNRNMRLMVNVCGHSLCENCVNVYFARGSGKCAQCDLILRRNNFRDQVFEDGEIDKDTDIRKKVLKDFNKKEEDFPTLREYNDYLEHVESIIFNLTNNVDIEQTKQDIEIYRKENQDNIRRNKSKLSHDQELIEMLLEEEQNERQQHQQQILEEEQHVKQEKQKQKNELIDNLMFSNLPAEHIIKTHRKDVVKDVVANFPEKRQIQPQIMIPRQDRFVPIRVEPAALFQYAPLHLDYCGPPLPYLADLGRLNYLVHIRVENEVERAGGFQSNIACYRALQDSFCGLFL